METVTWVPRSYKDYKWIVCDHDLLGGRPAIRGTRMSVSHILECLSQDMSVDEIMKVYGDFPKESIPEIYKFAAELIEHSNVAA